MSAATPILSPKSGNDALVKERDELRAEVRQLKASLKAETAERDALEDEARTHEAKIRKLDKALAQIKEELAQEQRERDDLDKAASQAEREKRAAELALSGLKNTSSMLQQEVDRLKEERIRARQRLDKLTEETDKEIEGLRQQVRAEKKSAKDMQFQLEEAKEDSKRQLNKVQGASKRETARLTARVEELEWALKTANMKLTVQSSKPGDAGQRQLEQALKEKLDAENEVAKLKAELAQKKEQSEEAAGALSQNKEAVAKLEADVKAAKEKADEMKDAIAKLEVANKKLEADLKDALSAKDDSIRVNKEIQTLKQKLEETEKDRKAFSDTITQLEESLSDAREAMERGDEAKQGLEDTAKELRAQVIESNEQLIAVRSQLDGALKAQQELQEQLIQAQQQLSQAPAAAPATEQGVPARDLESDKLMEEMRNDLLGAAAQLAGLEKECRGLKEQIPALTHERDSLNSQLTFAKQERNSIAQQSHRFKVDLDAQTAENAALKEKLAKAETDAKAKIAEITAAADSASAERDKAAKDAAKLAAELDSSKAELSSATEKFLALTKQLGELEAENDDTKQQLREEQITQKKGVMALEEEKHAREDAEEDAKRLKRKVDELESEAAKLKDDLQRAQASGAEATKKISEKASSGAAALEETVRRLEREKAAQATEAEKVLEERTEKLSQESLKLRKELLSVQDELKGLDEAVHKKEVECKKAQAKAADMEAEQALLLQTVAKLKAELKDAEDQASGADEESKLMAKKAKNLEETCAELDESKKELELQLAEEKKKAARLAADLEGAAAAGQRQAKEAMEHSSEQLAALEKVKKEAAAAQAKYEQEIAQLKKQLAAAAASPAPAPAPAAAIAPSVSQTELASHKTEIDRLKNENASLSAQLLDAKNKLSMAEAAAAAAAVPSAEGEEEGAGEESGASPAGGKLVGVRRAAPTGRRAPTLAGLKRAGKDVTGAVALMPAGITSELNAKRALAPAAAKSETKKSANKLIQLKGRRNVKSWVVEPVSSSLNSGDVFILDLGDRIFQWNGSKCNRLERSKAVDVVAKLNRSRGGRARVTVIDEGDTEPDDAFTFWKELGPKSAVKSDDGLDDAVVEAQMDASNKLFRLTSDAGDMERVEGAKLMYEMLDPNECYILDAGAEIYVWVGKGAPTAARNVAYAKAADIFESEKSSRPSCTEVVRCNQGGESVLFCEKFVNWPGEATLGPQKFVSNIAASKKQERIDVAQLRGAEPPEKAPDADDASGTVEVWRVVESEKEPVPKDRYGQFWSEHSYVVLYTYGSEDYRSYIIYFWQGLASTKNDMGTAAALALNMSKKYKGASQVRVVQQAEPAHFCKAFKGRIVVHLGSESKKPTQAARMYHVRGTSAADTTAVEVAPGASHLNTGDAAVVVVASSGKAYTWRGASAGAFTEEVCADLCRVLGMASPEPVAEGKEPRAFWDAIGASPTAEYGRADIMHPGKRTRAFLFTTKTGTVTADPVWRLLQSDLRPDGMLLLDSWTRVFLWIGSKTKEKEKKVGLETAMDYSKAAEEAEAERGKVEVLQVNEGSEPVTFTSHFHGWHSGTIAAPSAYAVAGQGTPAAAGSAGSSSVAAALEQYSKKYPYEQLKKKESLPATVDKARLEMYLSDEEFATVFGMSREKYLALPGWQQTPKKKAAGLF